MPILKKNGNTLRKFTGNGNVTTSHKAAFSLLISVLLFGVFTALSFTGLFDLIETSFYNPSITTSLTAEIDRNVEAIDRYLTELQTRFSETLKEPAVQRSFLPNQSAQDIFDRSRIYGLLQESLGGLQWVRFIDAEGSRLHFSTYEPDILTQDRLSLSYRNYNEPDLPYAKIAVNDGEASKYTLDGGENRILFSFPFYDSFDVYRGTALFSLSIKAVSDMLISEGRVKLGEDISIISDPPGFLCGMSTATEMALSSLVSSIWKEEGLKFAKLNSTDSSESLILISVKTPLGFFIGDLVNEDLFSLPLTMKIILLASFFLTVYLTIFLLFNLRQDPVTIVQNRLKQLQISLIEQYHEHKGDLDWNHWSRELEQRRGEISAHLKQGIKTAAAGKSADIDLLIDKSWDELFSVMGGRTDAGIDEEKLQLVLNRILAAIPAAQGNAAPTQIPVQSAPQTPDGSSPASPGSTSEEDAEPVEELEEAEDAEPVEELEEAEEVEPVEELEEAEAVEEFEPVHELEELVEPPDDESIEELPAVGPEEAGETTDADDVEELEELEEIEEAESSEAPAREEADTVPVIDVSQMNLPPVSDADEPERAENLNGTEITGEGYPQAPGENPQTSSEDLAALASAIEFSPFPETEKNEDVSIPQNLEIVSPFSTMLSDFSSSVEDSEILIATEDAVPEESVNETLSDDSREPEISGEGPAEMPAEEPVMDNSSEPESFPPDDEESEKKNETLNEFQNAILIEEINSNRELSLISTPFFSLDDAEIETLEVLSGGDNEAGTIIEDDAYVDDGGVIEEREGVHYINEEILNADPQTALNINRDFQKLVDSIIK